LLFLICKSCDLTTSKRFTKLKEECIYMSLLFLNSQGILSLLYICIRNLSLLFISLSTLPPGSVHTRNTYAKKVFFLSCQKIDKSFTSVFNIFIKYKKCQTIGDAYLTCLARTWPWTSPMASRPAKLRVDRNDHLPMILTAQLGAQV
jgi:hypothetical protein